MTIHKIKTVLVALGSSEKNHSHLHQALTLASSMGGRVVVVSIVPDSEGSMNRFFLREAREQLEAPCKKVLAKAEEYATSLGMTIETILRPGKPGAEICDLVQEVNADVVMLGSTKRNQMERVLLGRTTGEVIINSPCDVLLIPKDTELRFDTILAGIDGSAESNEAGARAIDLAKNYGSAVHALYVTNIPLDQSLRYGVSQESEQKGWGILEGFVDQSKAQGVDVVTDVRGYIPEECLAVYAEEKNIDLIVLGAKAYPLGLDLLCGSVVEKILSLTPCPVLVAKKETDVMG